MKRAPLVLGLLLLSSPLAAAAGIGLSTHHPARVSAAVVFELPEASVLAWSAASREPVVFAGASGRVDVWTWRVARVAEGITASEVESPMEDASSVAHVLTGTDLTLDPRGGPFGLVARMGPGGVARLRGDVEADVVPAWRGENVQGSRAPAEVQAPFRRPGEVEWAAAPGWHYVGNHLDRMPPHVPDAPGGAIELEGAARIQLDHGLATFTDRSGRLVQVELGTTTESPGVEVRRRLVFEGTLAPSTAPRGDQAGLTAPTAAWRVDGTVSWRDATGTARDPDAAFEGAAVVATGSFGITPTPPDLLSASAYAAEGEMEVLVDGALVQPPPSTLPARAQDAAWWLLALAALALLVRHGVFALYARLGPEDVLLHPRRRALWEEVQARPGMRKRDLQHALGLAWGAFSFHLRVLVSSGHVRVQREGAYSLVVPVASAADAHLPIGHPSTRAVYAALPDDGSALRVADLRRRVGYSRQRLDHHVRALEERGLVRVEREPTGARRVAREARRP